MSPAIGRGRTIVTCASRNAARPQWDSEPNISGRDFPCPPTCKVSPAIRILLFSTKSVFRSAGRSATASTVRCANLGEREPTQSLSAICSEWTELRSYWARSAFSGRSRQLISQEIAQSFPFAEAAADRAGLVRLSHCASGGRLPTPNLQRPSHSSSVQRTKDCARAKPANAAEFFRS